MFWLLENVGPQWAELNGEFSDARWTAFRQLAKVGGVEGVIRMRFLFGEGSRYEEYHLVKGDYANVEDGELFPQDSVQDLRVVKARLTGKGERWAGILSGASQHAVQTNEDRALALRAARALVLSSIWHARARRGAFQRLPHPNPEQEGRYVVTGRGGEGGRMGDLDPFDAALVWLVRLVRTGWSMVDFATFSAAEEEAFASLVEAGLLEARVVAFARMEGFETQVRLTCRVTGAYKQHLLKATLEASPKWLTADGRTRGATDFFYDIVEARLTAEGGRARQDIESGAAGEFLSAVRGPGLLEMVPVRLRAEAEVRIEAKAITEVTSERPWPPIHGTPPAPRRGIAVRPGTADGDSTTQPAVGAKDYECILNTIRHGCRTFERTPQTYARHGEEELRDMLLAILNGKLEGAATGETFRKSGRTDILIEDAGRAAFVAECKMWGGPAAIGPAVDQLLGYLTWRDSTGALIVFNKSVAGFTGILESLPRSLRSHPEVLQEPEEVVRGEWRLALASPDDRDRRITVHVFLFDLYVRPS